jgi:hypothetical protein
VASFQGGASFTSSRLVCRSTTGKRTGRLEGGLFLLLDDFHDAACSRFNQHRAPVHNRVTVLAYAIFGRDVVVADAFFRENSADSHIFAVLVRGPPLFDDVRAETRTLIDTEHAGYASNDTADNATNDCPDRTSRPFTISRAPLDSSGYTLGSGSNRKGYCDKNGSGSD